MPTFSIIVPTYNGQRYLDECLDSLLGQSYPDLEVVSVDDCSTDDSPRLLERRATLDPRLRVIHQSENGGSARARRRGALESSGSYILFCDQDDTLVVDACRILSDELSRTPVDILQYDTDIIDDGGVRKAEIDGLVEWLRPFDGQLSGRDILDDCFSEQLLGYTIWNKAYRGDFARDAMARTEDVAIPLGEDNYASFVLMFFADSYRGLPDAKLYHYHYGRGYTGHGFQSAASFERTIGLASADALIRSFLESEGAFEEYRDTYERARFHLIAYVIDRWYFEVAPADKQITLRSIVRHWGYDDVFAVMSRYNRRNLPLLFWCRKG